TVDPSGLAPWDGALNALKSAARDPIGAIHNVAAAVNLVSGMCTLVFTPATPVGMACAVASISSGGVQAVSGTYRYANGQQSRGAAILDSLGALFSAGGVALSKVALTVSNLSKRANAISYLRNLETDSAPFFSKFGPWVSSKWWAMKSALWGGL